MAFERELSAGDLTHRVAIKAWQDMPAMGGGISTTDTPLATVWGHIEPVGGALFFGTQQVGEAVTDRLFVRRNATVNERTVTAEHACECNGLRYRVRRASALNGGKVWLMIELECLGDV